MFFNFLSNFLCVVLGFLIQLFIFWPGELTPDSQKQHAAAVLQSYSDYHPFIMSWLWHYFDLIYKGPGLMLAFHLALLWGGVFFLAKSVHSLKRYYLTFFIPVIPSIFVYAGTIWKDVGFAFSFFFTLSFLGYTHLQKRELHWPSCLAVLAILAYGTLVKFQAFFLAPLILFWIAYEKSKSFQAKKYIPSLFIIGSIFYGMFYGIQFAGPKVQPDHSWQYVKFFDLAAISVDLNENLIPKANQKENFSFDTMKQILRPNRVDDLIFGEGSILKKGNSDEERNELYTTWLKEVTAHPFLYLKHRMFNMAYILLSVPEFEAIQSGISSIKILSESFEKYSHIFARIIGLIFVAHFLTVCTGIFYFFFALIAWIKRKTPASIPLFFFNTTALSMVTVIFFCSMAGTPRYTYISVLLIHASHFFAYLCWKDRKEKYVSTTF